MKLEDKVAIVTGAGHGIGRAIALSFAKEGAHISIAEINMKNGRKTAKEVRALGREALAIKCDVSRKAYVEKMVAKTYEKLGRIDILVNNAGVAAGGEGTIILEEEEEKDWNLPMAVNLNGTFFCSSAVARIMKKQGGGVIINISSAVGLHQADPLAGSYPVSKAAIISLTIQAAIEWGRYNIRVNSIAPGMIKTYPFTKYRFPFTRSSLEKRFRSIPLRRIGLPQDIAKAALFLASEESSYITGETLVVDGGLTHSLFWTILHWGSPNYGRKLLEAEPK